MGQLTVTSFVKTSSIVVVVVFVVVVVVVRVTNMLFFCRNKEGRRMIRDHYSYSPKLKTLMRYVVSSLDRFTTNRTFICAPQNGSAYLCHSDRCKMWINESFISDLECPALFNRKKSSKSKRKKGFEQRSPVDKLFVKSSTSGF